MGLTGVPLIALTLLATIAAIAATIVLWSRFGRVRLVSRAVGVLLCEALVVFSAGLIANRQQQFYPSWEALSGDTGTAATTAGRAPGTLDAAFAPTRLTLPWQPAGSAGWRLAAPARVAVPPGYLGAHGSYPALLALGGPPAAADLIRVSLQPTARTTAAALAGLPAQLGTGLRVTGHGWAVLASPPFAGLAEQLVRADPGRFSTFVVVGKAPAGFRCPPGVEVGVAAPGVPPRGATAVKGSWAAATGWATGRTPPPLAPPEVLPSAVVA